MPGNAVSGEGLFRYAIVPSGSDFSADLQPEFDDSGWASGQGAFGNQLLEEQCTTGATRGSLAHTYFDEYSQIHVRTHFTVPAGSTSVHVSGAADDYGTYYVNGVGVGDAPWDACSPATRLSADLGAGAWHKGDNVLFVMGRDYGGATYLSAEVSYTPPTVVPANPAVDAAAVGPGAIELTWADDEATDRWRVEVRPNGSSNSYVTLGTTKTLSFVAADLAPATDYEFKVVAENLAGDSPWQVLVAQTAAENSQTLSLVPPVTAAYGDVIPIAATSSAGLPVSLTGSGACTVTGLVATMAHAGICTLQATQPGDTVVAAAAPVQVSFAVARRVDNVVLTGLDQTYDGAGRAVAATVQQSGASLPVVYGDLAGPPVHPGSYPVLAAIDTPDEVGGAVGTLLVRKRPQTLNAAVAPALVAGQPGRALAATSSTGLPVVAFVAGPCHLDGGLIIGDAGGSCVVTVEQAGDVDTLPAAADFTIAVTAAPAAAQLLVDSTGYVYDRAPHGVSVTTDPAGLSGVSVTYNGSATAPTNAGDYTYVATLTNPDWTAPPVTGTFTITKAAQSIIIETATTIYVNAPPSPWVATATSGLSVSQVPLSGPCYFGSAGLVIGLVSASPGTCVIDVWQNTFGDSNYLAAPERLFVVEAIEAPPTPSPTTSDTPSPTPSPTPSDTPSPTPSPTVSDTPSPTPSPTPSDTPSPTPSPTPSDTPSPTPSPTPSDTPSPTPTLTDEPEPEPDADADSRARARARRRR